MKRFWTLKQKLLLFSIALLSIPFISVGFLKQLEDILVDNLTDNLSSFASAIAFTVSSSGQLNSSDLYSHQSKKSTQPLSTEPLSTEPLSTKSLPTAHSSAKASEQDNSKTPYFYVSSTDQGLTIDGFIDDWLPLDGFSRQFEQKGTEFRANVASDEHYLFINIQVDDPDIVYREVVDHFSLNDQIIVSLQNSSQQSVSLTFSPVGAGRIQPFINSRSGLNVWISEAVWQESANGYQLEVKLPLLSDWQGISVDVHNVNSKTNQTERLSSTNSGFNPLIWPNKALEKTLEGLALGDGKRVWLLNAKGQVQARKGSLSTNVDLVGVNPIIHFLFAPPVSDFIDPRLRAIELTLPQVKQALNGKVGSTLESVPGAETAIALVAYPVMDKDSVVGVVVVEQTVAAIQMIQRRAMNIYVNTSLMILLVVIVTLIILASRLTRRIMRLSQQTTESVDVHGRVVSTIKADPSNDELGALSQNFSTMSRRLKEYNEYMEKLSARLTHELRTPIAVVRSSIDNILMQLDHQDMTDKQQARTTIINAQQGVDRLSQMIARMQEASRLEQSILSAASSELDLVTFVENYLKACASLYPDNELLLSVSGQPKSMISSEELMAQLLDKLLSNARDFSISKTAITVELNFQSRRLQLSVCNLGEPLPQGDPEQLFSSMVSNRREKHRSSEQSHLGLGLYIVRLIAEYHKGNYFARNLEGNQGVMIGIDIPL